MHPISRPLALAVQMLLVFGALAGVMTGAGADEGKANARAVTLIHNVYELQNMSLDLNGSYELANDIDATVTAEWNNGTGFAPIGDHINTFQGTLDGKGYNITGLFINRTGPLEVGLIGMGGLDGDGNKIDFLKSIGVIDVNITGKTYVGGLVGFNSGTVSNSYVTGNVAAHVDDTCSCVGGLVGYNAGDVEASFAAADVSGGWYIGGLVGRNTDTVSNSYATGNVTAIGYVGGLVGENQIGVVSNSYATGQVTGSTGVGGLVGNNSATVSNGFWDTQTSGQASSEGGMGKTTAEMKTRSTFTDAGWDFDNIWSMIENVTYPYLRNVSVLPANYPPTITTSPVTNVTADSLYSVQFLASDPDGDSLSWNLTTNASWLGMTGAGLLSGTPSGADAGTYVVAVTVSDGRGGTDNLTFELSVSARHLIFWTDAPVDANLTEGDNYLFTAKAADTYPEHALVYSVNSTQNCTLTVNSTTGAIRWLNVTAGTYSFTLSVTDGELTISHDFVLSVARKHAISWTEVPVDASLTEGDNYTFTARAADTYPEHALVYSVNSAESCTLTVNSTTGAIQWFNVTAGTYFFTLSATDGELTVGHDFVLSVARKHAISWTEVPGDANLTEGDNYTFTAGAADTYPEHALVYSVNSTGNSTLTVNSSTGAIRWLNMTAGNYSCTLSATDGELTISHDFVLSVARKPGPYLPPAIISVTGPENITVKASSVQTFSVEATSPSNATLTYEWKDNGVVVSTDKTFSRKFAPGNHTLILLIGDGRYTTTRTFNFTVAPAPKTVEAKPVSIPGFEAGVAAAAVITVVAIGLFWRRERR
jgi:hypothetical protein